jgi:hypothetical protein
MRALTLLLLATGCFSYTPPKRTLLTAPAANPLLGQPKVCFLPPSLEGLQVDGKPVGDFKAAMTPKRAASFQADMDEFVTRFIGLAASWSQHNGAKSVQVVDKPEGAFTVATTIESLHLPGGTVITLLVNVRDPAGQVVESYREEMKSPSGYGSGDEIRALGILVPADIKDYVVARAKGTQLQ